MSPKKAPTAAKVKMSELKSLSFCSKVVNIMFLGIRNHRSPQKAPAAGAVKMCERKRWLFRPKIMNIRLLEIRNPTFPNKKRSRQET